MKLLILSFLLLYSTFTLANLSCSKNGTDLIYTNGVATSRKNAYFVLSKLKALNLNSQIDLKADKVNYILAYNYSESLSKDLIEATVQRLPKSYIDGLQVANAYEAYSYFLQGRLVETLSTVVLNSINQARLEFISSFAKEYFNDPLYSRTINEILVAYNHSFSQGKRVFAVSHSQGSLFMNDVWALLPENDNKYKFFSGFQIASALKSEMNTHFGYATHEKDLVINSVREIIGSLPPNLVTPTVVLSNAPDDFALHHGVISTYLNDPVLKPQVISKLINTAQLLESNCPKASFNYTKNNLLVSFNSSEPQNKNLTDLSYKWSFGDGKSSTTSLLDINHLYGLAGSYVVTLTVNDIYGNSDSISKSITIGSLGKIAICPYGYGPPTITVTIDGFAPVQINADSGNCVVIDNFDLNKSYHFTATSTNFLRFPVSPLEGILSLTYQYPQENFGVLGNSGTGFYITYYETSHI